MKFQKASAPFERRVSVSSLTASVDVTCQRSGDVASASRPLNVPTGTRGTRTRAPLIAYASSWISPRSLEPPYEFHGNVDLSGSETLCNACYATVYFESPTNDAESRRKERAPG